MKILGIETSCDETAASVVEVAPDKSHVKILSSVTATSLALHAKTGGIIPEVAARNQIQDIIPVIYEALSSADGVWPMANSKKDHKLLAISNKPAIDAIAITYGPGLIGSLLVGVETAKTLSYIWNIPLLPINHLFGHIYANWIETLSPFQSLEFPAIGLIVSGGHTDLLLMKSHTDITWLGGTRDDAAGEAFDKIGRMLGLSYPAGPAIENLAKKGNPKAFHFPRPLMYDKELDFSFSGLKTAVLREIQKIEKSEGNNFFAGDSSELRTQEKIVTKRNALIADICRGVQDAISDVLVYKTLQAVEKYNARSVIVGGGVAANETLKNNFQHMLDTKYKILNTKLFVPPKSLCTDNGVMIAAAALFQGKETPWEKITANSELYFD